MNYKAICIASVVLGVTALGAKAESASDFLKSLEGNYSGRGKAVVVGDKTTRISCKISNTFSADANKLSIGGNCASTKGKGKVNGSLLAKGKKLSGTFISPRRNAKITKSSASLKQGKLHLFASMMDESAGKLVRVHQQISKTAKGISAVFFTYDNKTKRYKKSGSIELKKR